MINNLKVKQAGNGLDEIYQEGYQAGYLSEQEDELPPYSGIEAEYWSDGFQDGKEDHKQDSKNEKNIIDVLGFLEKLDLAGLNGSEIKELTGVHQTQRQRWIDGNKKPLLIDGVLYTAAEIHKGSKSVTLPEKILAALKMQEEGE